MKQSEGWPSKEVLIVIGSDPRISARPAEAVRVADGLSQSEELRISLLISGAAAEAFGAPDHEWIEGPLLLKHLMALKQRQVRLYLQGRGTPALIEHLPLESIDGQAASALRAGAPLVIDF